MTGSVTFIAGPDRRYRDVEPNGRLTGTTNSSRWVRRLPNRRWTGRQRGLSTPFAGRLDPLRAAAWGVVARRVVPPSVLVQTRALDRRVATCRVRRQRGLSVGEAQRPL